MAGTAVFPTSSQSALRKVQSTVFVSLTFWSAFVVAASAAGWLSALGRNAPPIAAVVTMLIPVFGFALWPGLRQWVRFVGVRRLTAIHILRAMATPLFLWYGAKGLVPEAFALRAGWGDTIAAIAALVAVTIWRKPLGYALAQVIGLVDFIEAFSTAMRASSHNPAAMRAVTVLPLSLIPFFFVGILAACHVFALYMILQRDSSAGFQLLRPASRKAA